MTRAARRAPRILAADIQDRELPEALKGLDADLLLSSTDRQFLDMAPMADAVIMSAAHLTGERREALRGAPDLRWLHLLNAGVDTIRPSDFGPELRITYSPGAGAATVAEHGLALMLALSRAFPRVMEAQGQRKWDYGLGAEARSLRGSKVLVLGFGHIGKALARLLLPFEVHLTAVTARGTEQELADASCGIDDADAHLRTHDHIVIAAPLTERTRGYFDAARLSAVKPGACLVNLSRGGIVDLAALRKALEEGRLAGAAIDVADPEPLPADHPIWGAPNLVITPHMAAGGAGPQDRRHLARLAAENCRRFIQDEPLLHRVMPGAD